MKKRLCLFIALFSVSASFAGISYISPGEYIYDVWLENSDQLIVNGGGTNSIDAWDSSRIEVYSTSLPLVLYQGGVYDIHLSDNSSLLFTGGATQSLKLGNNAAAELRGGQINYITIYHYGSMTSNVTIYCQKGYQMDATGISGLWEDGTAFQIAFSNAGSIFPDTWNFVNVITPEPATLALLALGGLMLCRRK